MRRSVRLYNKIYAIPLEIMQGTGEEVGTGGREETDRHRQTNLGMDGQRDRWRDIHKVDTRMKIWTDRRLIHR